MSARFIKLARVQVQGYDARGGHLCEHCLQSTVSTADIVLNVEAVVTVVTDDDAETGVVTLVDGRVVLVSGVQAKAIEAAALGEESHA